VSASPRSPERVARPRAAEYTRAMTSNERPLVLVSCRRTSKDAEIGISTVHSADDAYVECLRRAGALPLLAPVAEDESEARAALARAAGLVLTGGEDVHPAVYGEEVHPRCGEIDTVRDRFDIALVRESIRAGIPLLAICRGVQVLNVALGGTLFQDIEAELPGAIGHRPRMRTLAPSHAIAIEAKSLLREIAGCDTLSVNSSHHQAVKDVAPALRITARSRDGVVEALESAAPGAGPAFVLGLQFHPERHPTDAFTSALFRKFVAAATAPVPSVA